MSRYLHAFDSYIKTRFLFHILKALFLFCCYGFASSQNVLETRENPGLEEPLVQESLLVQNSEDTILFVHNEENIDESNGGSGPRDQPFIDKLVSEGYVVLESYEENLAYLSEEELILFNEADLVIVGRSSVSGIFRDGNKKAWNRIKAPLMNMSPFAARSNRANWFPSENALRFGLGIDDIALDSVITAKILDTDDPALAGVDIGDGTIDWFIGPYRTLYLTDDQYDSSAATHIAIIEATPESANPTDDALLMARFGTGVEFYTGAGDSAAAPRSFFGLGNDDTTYYNLSSKAEQIWLNEIEHLLNMEYTPLDFPSPNSGLLDLTLDEELVVGFRVDIETYEVMLTSNEIPFVDAHAIHDEAEVIITQATTIPGTATVEVLAEDSVSSTTYAVNFSYLDGGPNVLFVGDVGGAASGAADEQIIDSLQSWGFRVTYWHDDDYASIKPDHSAFHIAFFSESMSSQTSSYFREAGYPLPLLLMEPFAAYSTEGRLGLADDVAVRHENSNTEIIDTDHPITSVFSQGEILNMTDFVSPDGQQIGINFKPELSTRYFGRAEGEVDYSFALIEPSGMLCQDLIYFGWSDGAALSGSEDFWKILDRSLEWLLNSDCHIPSTETDILYFEVEGQVESTYIDTTNYTVSLEIAPGKDITALSPTIIVSPWATISPERGTAQNFTDPVVYTVTAEDGVHSQDWTVYVHQDVLDAGFNTTQVQVYPNPTSDILHFTGLIPGSSIEIYRMDGKRVIHQFSESESLRIDMQNLAHGIYLIKINGRLFDHHKVIKQ